MRYDTTTGLFIQAGKKKPFSDQLQLIVAGGRAMMRVMKDTGCMMQGGKQILSTKS